MLRWWVNFFVDYVYRNKNSSINERVKKFIYKFVNLIIGRWKGWIKERFIINLDNCDYYKYLWNVIVIILLRSKFCIFLS